MQHPRPIISILTVTNLIAMCGRLRVGKKFLHVCRLVISTATATAMFPALDAAPVVACTKAMPCNAQPSSPSPGNRRGSNGPSFFNNPVQYGRDRVINGVMLNGLDNAVNKIITPPPPPHEIQPISNPPSNYAPGGFVYPTATRTPSD